MNKKNEKERRAEWYRKNRTRIREQQREAYARKKAEAAAEKTGEASTGGADEAGAAVGGKKKRSKSYIESVSPSKGRPRVSSTFYEHWKPKRRVKVESGWRGRPCAGGGSARNGFVVSTAVDWKD